MQADGQLSVFQTSRADPSRLVVQTGQHDRRAVLLIERAHPLLRLALGLRRGRRVAAEQDRRLGGIRGDEVRDRAELAHPRAHFGRIAAVHLAVVAHDRVDERQTVLRLEALGRLAHAVDLRGRAEEAGIHRLEPQTETVVLVDGRVHLPGQVALDPARYRHVRGKDRRRQRDALMAERRQHRYDRHERRAPEAG